MIEEFPCEACGGRIWCPFQRFRYLRSDHEHPPAGRLTLAMSSLAAAARRTLSGGPPARPLRRRILNSYQIARRQVLFDVWFPGRDEIVLCAVYCATCEFTTYLPRPEPHDVAAKYHFLKRIEPDIGGETGHDRRARASDADRADRVFARAMAHVRPGGRLRVLDHGGGNGKLMRPFIAAGHECCLVDYNDTPIPSVKKLGEHIDDVAQDDRFDVIVCSHVLEHISDVEALSLALVSRLCAGGVMYVEVPLEIWAGIWIDAEPVTHINFFTIASLWHLFERIGVTILATACGESSYGRRRAQAVWLVATSGVASAITSRPRAIERLIFPGRVASVRRVLSRWWDG